MPPIIIHLQVGGGLSNELNCVRPQSVIYPKGPCLSMHRGGSADRTLKICTCEHSLQALGAASNEEPHALRCVFSGFAWQRSLGDDRGLLDLDVLIRVLDENSSSIPACHNLFHSVRHRELPVFVA